MLCRVALTGIDVSEETSASIIRVTRIREAGITPAINSNRRKLRRNTMYYFQYFSSQRAWLLVTANVVPSSPLLVTIMMQALSSSETPVLTRVTRRNVPEYGILHLQVRFS
jgi:hypothetical protein